MLYTITIFIFCWESKNNERQGKIEWEIYGTKTKGKENKSLISKNIKKI